MARPALREKLEVLCRGGGWSYAVTWRADCREPRLLAIEETYYEDQIRLVVQNMLSQVHIIGEGVIGGAVLSKKCQWICADTCGLGLTEISYIDNLDMFQGYTWWHHQFLEGIKTIAIIPLQSIGVVQFGSLRRVSESTEFTDKVKLMLGQTENLSEFFLNGGELVQNYANPQLIPPYFPYTLTNPSQIQIQTQTQTPPNQIREFPLVTLNYTQNTILSPEQSVSLPNEDQLINLPENDLLESMITELSSNNLMHEWWDDFITPDHGNSNASVSGSISNGFDFDSGSTFDQLLDSIVSDPENKKNNNNNNKSLVSQFPLFSNLDVPTLDYNTSNNNSNSNGNNFKPKDLGLKHECKSVVDDSCSMNINNNNNHNNNGKKIEEASGKLVKKRARPGESTRPRPKDRQQIQDRVKELREIVPNGAKCSIDALLDRTIKHMLFLQSVTKYAEKVKQADEPKMIGEESGVVLKDNSSGMGGGGGATWAYEVAGQTMVCPIIVEDLTPPGQMLVEMLCEERGFFLEIADIIRGFGLTILKGVMELRESKIWARFLVEANRDVTRMDIFLSLVQLLQQTSSARSSDQLAKVIERGPQSFKNYNQSSISIPVGLGQL